MTVPFLSVIRLPVACFAKASLGDAGDERADRTAADDGENERGDDGGTEFGKDDFHIRRGGGW